jgi:quercetin dioxygenase-like cupin family protein
VGVTLVERDAPGSEEAIHERFAREGLHPRLWSGGPGLEFDSHTHPRAKLLYCVKGSITFRAGPSSYRMGAGDRLEIDPGTEHGATVGPDGVECAEAFR